MRHGEALANSSARARVYALAIAIEADLAPGLATRRLTPRDMETRWRRFAYVPSTHGRVQDHADSASENPDQAS